MKTRVVPDHLSRFCVPGVNAGPGKEYPVLRRAAEDAGSGRFRETTAMWIFFKHVVQSNGKNSALLNQKNLLVLHS